MAAGGFDEDLRFGEDVDLVWRLDESGLRVRYEPAGVVDHEPRPTLRAWLSQRASYGRSAADLAERHPGAAVPLAVSGWSAAVWALAAAGAPVAALTTAGAPPWPSAGSCRTSTIPSGGAAAHGAGHLFAGRMLASAITRAWWPVVLALALVSRRARRVLAAAALLPALVDWVRQRPPLDPVRYVGLRVLDDAAYGTGLWHGAFDRRTAAPLLPDLTSWPRPSRYDRDRGR
jgi:mycofactocin system glycosyltransferase